MSRVEVPASATAEEAAAIVAAIALVWPQAAPPAAEPNGRSGTSWRFSGRWWMDQRIQGRPLRLS